MSTNGSIKPIKKNKITEANKPKNNFLPKEREKTVTTKAQERIKAGAKILIRKLLVVTEEWIAFMTPEPRRLNGRVQGLPFCFS